MKQEFDFSKMKSVRNPYPKMLKSQITINLANPTIDYFKQLASQSGIKYQSLINMYLTECAAKRKKIHLMWK